MPFVWTLCSVQDAGHAGERSFRDFFRLPPTKENRRQPVDPAYRMTYRKKSTSRPDLIGEGEARPVKSRNRSRVYLQVSLTIFSFTTRTSGYTSFFEAWTIPSCLASALSCALVSWVRGPVTVTL